MLTVSQLRKLHYNGHNEEWLQSEFNEIQITIQAEKAITAPGWMVMFNVPQWRTRLMHATLIQVFTQMTTGHYRRTETSRHWDLQLHWTNI